MKLQAYIETLGPTERERFAAKLDTSWAYVTQLASGFRRPGAKVAVAIEKHTKGAVPVESLLPEVEWKVIRKGKA
jgi:DNA-binding transcriptional regulator YdaS (Cro superfamily)